MKRQILLFVIMLSAVSVTAQTYWDSSRPDHRFTFGIRAGGNFSKVFHDNDEWRYHLGYQAGLTADVNLVRSLSVGAGVYYIQKGFKLEVEVTPSDVLEFEYTPSYIEIPLQLSYHIKLSDSSQFHLHAGGYYAAGIKSSDENFFRDYDGYDSTDFGLILGASATYDHFYAGASYERGLKNISTTADDHGYNSSIIISLGYNF